MANQRILIVEDEPAIAELLEYNLVQDGFAVEIVNRGDLAFDRVKGKRPNLVLLDLMLPGLNGLEVARLLRQDPTTAGIPLIMITARDSEIDRIVGLELGADDYITKPFSPREVVLRVRAVLRRNTVPETESSERQVGRIRLDVFGHRAWVDEEELPLTATEFKLLQLFVERCGRVQTRAQLLRDVWGYADDVESRTADTHVRRLRLKLGPAGEQVETVVGVGYRLRP